MTIHLGHKLQIQHQYDSKKNWCPTSTYKNDKNIMEQAVKDSTFHGKDNWKLKIINHCQLYCQVFFIGDMMGKNGKASLKWLKGGKETQNII